MVNLDNHVKKLIERAMVASICPVKDRYKGLDNYPGHYVAESDRKIALNYDDDLDSYVREFDKKTGKLLTKIDVPEDFVKNPAIPYTTINPILYVNNDLYLAGASVFLKIDEHGTLFKICTEDDSPEPKFNQTLYRICFDGNIYEACLSEDRKCIIFSETNASDYLDVKFDTRTNIFSVKAKKDECTQSRIGHSGIDISSMEGEYPVTPIKLDVNVRQ